MRLLLTSAGIRNESIAEAFASLHGKEVANVKVGFVPTTANVESGNKDWFIRQLTFLQSYGYEWIDVVDIATADVDWRARLSQVDVLMLSGGNTFYLLDQVRKTGFDTWLKANLGSKVYVGISAGSILATPSIAVAGVDNGDVNVPGIADLRGLSLVQFEVSPHTPESVSHEGNRAYKATIASELYALDDESALVVTDDVITVVSEGEWVLY